MSTKTAIPDRIYELSHWPRQVIAPGEPAGSHFVVQDVLNEQRRWAFGSLEQVMDFLLDEVLGPNQPGSASR